MSRRLIRLLAGVVFVGASLSFTPTPAAVADHDCAPGAPLPGTNTPCPVASRGVVGAITGWHEAMPTPRTATHQRDCAVRGGVTGGMPPSPPGIHDTIPAGVDDPAHSHFNFLSVTIACDDGTLTGVTAEGGNDGHIVDDYYAPGTPTPCGPAGCVETPNNCTFEHGVGPRVGGFPGYGSHHGSMTESGWSHSSGYSSGPAACPEGVLAGTSEHSGGNGPGPCVNPPNVAPGPGNNNKADVVIRGIGGTGEGSFVKYVRLGNNVVFWGCSNGLGPPGGMLAPFARRFSGNLSISPDPATPGFPACVPPGGPSCDLILVGSAVRGDTWL